MKKGFANFLAFLQRVNFHLFHSLPSACGVLLCMPGMDCSALHCSALATNYINTVLRTATTKRKRRSSMTKPKKAPLLVVQHSVFHIRNPDPQRSKSRRMLARRTQVAKYCKLSCIMDTRITNQDQPS